MKIKSIMRVISASITLLAFFMFLFIGCSKDDANDESDAFSPGYTWPEGDYPSLTAPEFNDAPTIGDPVLTLTAKHAGEFSPLLLQYLGKNWHGNVNYNQVLCDDDTRNWSADGELWNTELPSQHLYFDLSWLCGDEDFTYNANDFGWDISRRFLLMEEGEWSSSEFEYEAVIATPGEITTLRTKFNQVLTGYPDLHMSIHRDWIYEYGTDVIRSGEGTREITTETKTGVVDTQISTISETLQLGAEVSYGPVSASINQTFSSETTNQIEFSEFTTKTITETYIIPADETWRFITLYGVERYSFTDINGDQWGSPNLVTEELGYIEDHVRTFLMIVKYKSTSVSPINSELIELDL